MGQVTIKHVSPKLILRSRLAIVSSSAKLLDGNYGKSIDKHPDVIRFNRAPTEGYEDHVGSKTTLRLVNNHVFRNQKFTRWKEDDNFVKNLRKANLLLIRETHYAANRHKFIHDSVNLYTLAENFASIMGNETGIKIRIPTVGLMGIMLAVVSGIKPTVYGWSTTPDEPMSHYYNKREETCSQYHKWSQEMEVVRRLADQEKIELV